LLQCVQLRPAICPFNDCHARLLIKVLVNASASDSSFAFEAIKVEVKERAPTTGVFVDQGKRWRLNTRRDAEPFGQTLYKVRLACAEITNESDDPAGWSLPAPVDAQGVSFVGTVG